MRFERLFRPARALQPRWIGFGLLATVLFCSRASAQVTVPGAPGNPYLTIQDGINAASPNGLVFVGAGTYNEDPVLTLDLTVIATGTVQINGSCLFLNVTSATRFVGFTVTAAPGTPALRITDSSPSIEQCTLENNSATWGAGARVLLTQFGSSADPVFSRCTFRDNVAEFGGGAYISRELGAFSAPSATFEECVFDSNVAAAANDAIGFGGGVYYDADTIGSLTECMFFANSADYGGGLFAEATQALSISKCLFQSNTYMQAGGGACLLTCTNPRIADCVFADNVTPPTTNATAGGGLFVDGAGKGGGDVEIFNSLFVRNQSRAGGGAFLAAASPAIGFCTFSQNFANYTGGGLCLSGVVATIGNSILFNDSQGFTNPNALWLKEITYDVTSTVTVSFCDVEGATTHPSWAPPAFSNLDVNPQFRTGTFACPLAPSSVGGFFLNGASPCREAGAGTIPPLWSCTTRNGALDINIADMGFHYPDPSCP